MLLRLMPRLGSCGVNRLLPWLSKCFISCIAGPVKTLRSVPGRHRHLKRTTRSPFISRALVNMGDSLETFYRHGNIFSLFLLAWFTEPGYMDTRNICQCFIVWRRLPLLECGAMRITRPANNECDAGIFDTRHDHERVVNFTERPLSLAY